MHGRAITLLVSLFKWVGLWTNTTKTECVTFLPGKIRVRLSNRAYAQCQEGLVSLVEWEHRAVQCGICGLKLQAWSLYQHFESQDEVYWSRIINQDLLLRREEQLYWTCCRPAGDFYCGVLGCNGLARTKRGWEGTRTVTRV